MTTRFIHDYGCGATLDAQGVCPPCGYAPDGQSVAALVEGPAPAGGEPRATDLASLQAMLDRARVPYRVEHHPEEAFLEARVVLTTAQYYPMSFAFDPARMLVGAQAFENSGGGS